MALTVHANNKTYQFDGPYTSTDYLRDESGVYVITTVANGFHKVLDVGESHKVKERVSRHDRSELWQNHKVDTLYVSALYCDGSARMIVEGEIRGTHNPPCGDR